jgi:GNAT superfamily N-acetyltransferase
MIHDIRVLQPKEINKLMPIIHAHGRSAELDTHDPLDEKVCFDRLREAMIDPNFRIFVCEQDQQMVAYAVAQLSKKLYNDTIVGHIVMFFVLPEARSKTLSDQLWEVCEDFFYSSGANSMEASCVAHTAEFKPTVKFLDRAQSFYRSKGAECVGYIHMKGLT